MKLALSQKLSRIIQYAQNKEAGSSGGAGRRPAKLLCYSQQGERRLLPQQEAQVPRYAPCWDRARASGLPDYTVGMLEGHTAEELGLLQDSQPGGWSSDGKALHSRSTSSGGGGGGGALQLGQQGRSRDEREHSYCDFFSSV